MVGSKELNFLGVGFVKKEIAWRSFVGLHPTLNVELVTSLGTSRKCAKIKLTSVFKRLQ